MHQGHVIPASTSAHTCILTGNHFSIRTRCGVGLRGLTAPKAIFSSHTCSLGLTASRRNPPSVKAKLCLTRAARFCFLPLITYKHVAVEECPGFIRFLSHQTYTLLPSMYRRGAVYFPSGGASATPGVHCANRNFLAV